jgi:LPXTG-motif cell wall-anchored protein
VHRILAGLIAVLLAGAVATAIVKNSNESTPLVVGTPTPTQTYTYEGPPPTVPLESETPIIPPTESPTVSPTSTLKGLPNTGSSSTVSLALLMLGLGLGGGLAVRRAARGTR